MPSLVRFLTSLSIILTVSLATLYVLAVIFEPNPREISHEIINLTLEK